MPSVEITYEHPGVVSGFQAPVFVCWWRKAPALPFAKEMIDTFVEKATSTPGGIIFLVITSTENGIPDRAAADVLTKGTRLAEKHILAHGFVIEGTGIKAGAIRTSVKTIQSLARVVFPWTIASTVDEAALWITKKTGFISEPEAHALIANIKEMRASRK